MNPLEQLHEGCVARRRVRRLSGQVAELIPRRASVLDVGCGDGRLAAEILQQRPDLALRGIDTLVQARVRIPVEGFDGRTIPYADASVDVVLLVDTVHHADDPLRLLREVARVARRSIVVKDHTCEGPFARQTLQFMDWIGNARFGIARPGIYWSKPQWDEAIASLGLIVAVWNAELRLYPWPVRWLFERSLHFLAKLSVHPKA